MHPLYDPDTAINDIALTKLPEAVTLTGKLKFKSHYVSSNFLHPFVLDAIALVALPPLSDATNTLVGTVGKASGFGLLGDSKYKYLKTFNMTLNLMF